MTSPFRPRRRSPDGEPGSGGKMPLGRRATTRASPYQRPPPPPALSPPRLEPRSPSWLSGIITGAGKIISTVFGSDGSSQSPSSSACSSDEDIISISSEDEDIDTTAEFLHEQNQGGKELVTDHVEASSAIVPKCETKLAIEHLLMQETFSRDEYKKLVEILESRVVDCPSPEVREDAREKETLNNTYGNDISLLEGYQSLNQYNELQGAIPNSSDKFSSPSPGFSALQARTPDLRATAVMEAKKWLEGKTSTSSSKGTLDYGPCQLNTDFRHYGVEGELGSPVDMAKSYMQSLPPWQSPLLCSIGFKTPSRSATHLYKDHTHATNGHSSPSSKDLKRNYIAVEPLSTLDEIRSVRMKSTSILLGVSNNGQTDPSTSFLNHKASIISSADEKRDSVDHSTNGALSLPGKKAIEVSHSMETGSFTPVSIISKLPETLSDPDVQSLDENPDVEEPPLTKESISSFSVPKESLVLPSTPMERDGGPSRETKTMLPEEIKSADTRDGEVPTNHKDVQISSGIGKRLRADKSLAMASGEEIHPTADLRPRGGDTKLQAEAEESAHKIAANGAPAGYRTNSHLESKRKRGPIPILGGASELRSEAALVHSTESPRGKSPSGLRRNQTEGTSRRGKKVVVRSTRGRGRVQ